MSYPLLRRSVTITTANQAIRLNEGGVAYTALVTPGVYWVRDSGANSLNLAVKAAIEAITPTNTYTLTTVASIDPTLPNAVTTLTRATGAATFSIDAATPLTTFPMHALGFAVATALDSAPKVSTKSASGLWVSNDMLTVDEPDETGEVFGDLPTRGGVVVAGSQSDQWEGYRWAVAFVARARTWTESNTTDPNATWQAFWRHVRAGAVLELTRLHPVTKVETALAGQWVADKATRTNVGPVRRSAGSPIYSWPLVFQKWVVPS